MQTMLSKINWESLSVDYSNAKPFKHIVIDNFFVNDFAKIISNQFPKYNKKLWFEHDNPIEIKKLNNNWNLFPPETYLMFTFFCHVDFISQLEKMVKVRLYPDYGLNGGGWHIHSNGGKLNIHKDYSVHPKLGLQRKLNLIVFMTMNWEKEYGGSLELWSHDKKLNGPFKKEKEIDPIFNRAIIFDTSVNSWHGLPRPMKLPKNVFRKTITSYYLTDIGTNIDKHKRALFYPTEEQKGDKNIESFIKNRSEWKSKSIEFDNPYENLDE